MFQTVQMLESPAYQSLSINARRALDRLEIEHRAHAGLENGELRVSPPISRIRCHQRCLTNAIRELESKGFVEVQIGRGGRRSPSAIHLQADVLRNARPERNE